MRYVKLNTSPMMKYLPGLIGLLLISVLLIGSACGAPTPSTPPTPPTPPTPANESPVITSLTVQKEASALSASPVTCAASDADGDTLTYRWLADGGTIQGEGDNITWVAPDIAGDYIITVTVTDGKGGTVTKSATVAVTDKPNQPPVISGITIDGNVPAEETRVKQYVTSVIQCKAQDPDGDKLTYLWKATGGKITGEGSTVSWTSPGLNADHTITVVVSDGRDGKAEASVVFQVACCGGGF